MTKNEKLVQEFEQQLQASHLQIQQQRERIRQTTGSSMPKNRAKWLKNLTIKQAKEHLES